MLSVPHLVRSLATCRSLPYSLANRQEEGTWVVLSLTSLCVGEGLGCAWVCASVLESFASCTICPLRRRETVALPDNRALPQAGSQPRLHLHPAFSSEPNLYIVRQKRNTLRVWSTCRYPEQRHVVSCLLPPPSPSSPKLLNLQELQLAARHISWHASLQLRLSHSHGHQFFCPSAGAFKLSKQCTFRAHEVTFKRRPPASKSGLCLMLP